MGNNLQIPGTDRKRAHNEISQDSDQVDSSNSTPQKRTKRSDKLEPQGVRDSDVSEGQYDVQVIAQSSLESPSQDAVSGSIHLAKEIGAIPSINWNIGTKAKIRTTLGGGLGKAKGQEKPQQQETAKTQSKIQTFGPSPFCAFLNSFILKYVLTAIF